MSDTAATTSTNLVLVLGTGTGAGKTWVTAALGAALGALGPTLCLKPIESGMADPSAPDALSDSGRLAAASTPSRVPSPPLYGFRPPVSPHLAARREGVEIQVAAVTRWVAAQRGATDSDLARAERSWTLVETAGGAWTPLSAAARNVDLWPALAPDATLLVAPNRLGVLHDVGATLAALAARGLRPTALILSDVLDDAVRDESATSNAEELAHLEGLPLFCFAHGGRAPTPLVDLLVASAKR